MLSIRGGYRVQLNRMAFGFEPFCTRTRGWMHGQSIQPIDRPGTPLGGFCCGLRHKRYFQPMIEKNKFLFLFHNVYVFNAFVSIWLLLWGKITKTNMWLPSSSSSRVPLAHQRPAPRAKPCTITIKIAYASVRFITIHAETPVGSSAAEIRSWQ